eukprot:12064604-Alexandrium_andersonii.AAC.1
MPGEKRRAAAVTMYFPWAMPRRPLARKALTSATNEHPDVSMLQILPARSATESCRAEAGGAHRGAQAEGQ